MLMKVVINMTNIVSTSKKHDKYNNSYFYKYFFPGCNEAFYILYLSLKSVGNQEYKT